jgi:hypothetical protein
MVFCSFFQHITLSFAIRGKKVNFYGEAREAKVKNL